MRSTLVTIACLGLSAPLAARGYVHPVPPGHDLDVQVTAFILAAR
jgi:hypothetical protein